MTLEKVPEVVKTTEKSTFEYRLTARIEHDSWIDYLYEQWLIPDTNNAPIDASKENHGFDPILTGYKRFQMDANGEEFHARNIEITLTANNIK